MPLRIGFTNAELEKLGVLVNNVSVCAIQILSHTGSGFSTRALAHLAKLKREHEELLKRLDELAREHSEESPLRLIEDLPRLPSDVAQGLTLVRRCLSASAFIGHLLAQPADLEAASEVLWEEKHLH